ncbi:shikimate dehydrogenase [Bosea sp. 124]|uniref:shikimate dehydrogenase family protein n=1 Tax=Bosea sp. 124 TaxID=2135642 RepID=UPI000D3ACD15|nr:shikimate dehydrogenase [Bosea sp. 124]PTM43354.1 shikimate dehydrogenase [Bosea sp. 124]
MTDISGHTRVYAILADPVHHVLTPQRLNALMHERGHDGVMVPVHVGADDLATVVGGLKRIRSFGGFVVTVPHKTAIVALCDEVSRQAGLVGAVNCVRREADGRLVGEILDGLGFVAGMRREGFEPKGRRVLLLGAGGAANAVAFALAEAGVASLSIANRTRAKSQDLARRLAQAFPALAVDLDEPGATSHDLAPAHDIIVNGTSLGLAEGDPLPLDASRIVPGQVVAEVIMQPRVTALLAAAQARGCRVHYGLPMLECQLEMMADFMGMMPSGMNSSGNAP